jgi:hypothetical protein
MKNATNDFIVSFVFLIEKKATNLLIKPRSQEVVHTRMNSSSRM